MSAVTVTLDGKGRCCGRKPLVYRRPKPGYLFCSRCCAQFDMDGKQQANWAWLEVPGGFWPPLQANKHHMVEQYAKAHSILGAQ